MARDYFSPLLVSLFMRKPSATCSEGKPRLTCLMFTLRAAICVLASFFLASPAFGDETWYMDTPSGYQGMGGASRIGPYSSENACKSVNDANFGGQGTCVCTDSGSTSYGSTGSSQPDYSEDRRIRHQMELQNAQRVMQEQEQSRRRMAQEKAKKTAEEQARISAEAQAKRLEWQAKKNDLMGSLKGAGSTDLSLKPTTGQTMELKPKGTDFFGISLKKHENDIVIPASQLSSQQLPASVSQMENLRRSLWLYQKAAMAQDEEEAHFLSSQADEAAQGHPLRVEVPGAEKMSEITPEKIAEFKKLATVVARDKIELDNIALERTHIEERKTTMNNKFETLKREIEARKQQAQPETVKTENAPVKAEPKTEKKKGGDDLMTEYLALEKEIKDTQKEADDLVKKEARSKEGLDQHRKNLDAFLGKS